MKYFLAVTLIFLFSFSTFSQVQKKIDQIEKKLEICLSNPSNNMLNCTINYYNDMDELLNLVYHQLRSKMSDTNKRKLKEDQLKWLKKRDFAFKEIEKETQDLFDGDNHSQDYYMECQHQKGIIVRDRIKQLNNWNAK